MTEFSSFDDLAMSAGQTLDAVGVVIIFAGAIIATVAGIVTAFRADDFHAFYKSYRHNLARSIVTGLDFLVAGDIIRTVAGDLNLTGVLTLSIIVIIRIVISTEFEMTLFGRWPWSIAKEPDTSKAAKS